MRSAMTRRRKTITFSFLPEIAEQVREVTREEGRTMSELIREALRLYMEERERLRTIRYERAECPRGNAGGREEDTASPASSAGNSNRMSRSWPKSNGGSTDSIVPSKLPTSTFGHPPPPPYPRAPGTGAQAPRIGAGGRGNARSTQGDRGQPGDYHGIRRRHEHVPERGRINRAPGFHPVVCQGDFSRPRESDHSLQHPDA